MLVAYYKSVLKLINLFKLSTQADVSGFRSSSEVMVLLVSIFPVFHKHTQHSPMFTQVMLACAILQNFARLVEIDTPAVINKELTRSLVLVWSSLVIVLGTLYLYYVLYYVPYMEYISVQLLPGHQEAWRLPELFP